MNEIFEGHIRRLTTGDGFVQIEHTRKDTFILSLSAGRSKQALNRDELRLLAGMLNPLAFPGEEEAS